MRAFLTLVGAVGVGAAVVMAAPSSQAHTTIRRSGLTAELPHVPTGPLIEPIDAPRHVPIHPRTDLLEKSALDPINLRLLVISADGNEADLPAIKQILSFLGAPYDVYVAAQTPNGLTAARLYNGPTGFYQGIILTTGSLAYFNGSQYVSALTATEWQTLWMYEATFGIRQVTWYTFPNADYGFQPPTSADTTPPSPPVLGNLTTDGASVFSTLNAANPVSLIYAWTYLALPLTDGLTTTLLADSQGHALAAVRTYPAQGNRANLALTFDSNPYLIHNLVLAYGVVNWVTGGLFLGERHSFLAPQVDDVFIDDDIWWAGLPCGSPVDNTGVMFRMDGDDVNAVLGWQAARQADPITQAFRLSLAFNGVGTTNAWNTDNGYLPDTLTPALTLNQNQFNWISHTYDHTNLNGMSYGDAKQEFGANNDVATQLGLTNFTQANLVTPDVSGLTTQAVMNAAYDSNIRYTVTDTSLTGYDNPSPNAGLVNPLQTGILMVPRRPTNLYYNVSAPAEWAAEYNCAYHNYWGRDLMYQEILDKESQQMLFFLLRGDVDPLMFHQPNLINFPGSVDNESLLSDLVDMTIGKYESLLNLPILSPTENEIAVRMAQRMAYNASGVTAYRTPGSPATITLHVVHAATIPVTGLCGAGSESYGGQCIMHVSLADNETRTIQLP